MKKFDVCALGELLIDFTENGISPQGNPLMEANPGGAPCNVLAMLQKQGYKTAFIGKIGEDIFGRQLKNSLDEIGINTDALAIDKNVNTTLAFVHTLKGGDREFSFYRNPGADMMLNEGDINTELIKNSRIFHFGSLSMTNEVCEKATKKAVETAKGAGALISFDPNLRENLWDSLENAREKIAYGISQCDILKISDNEILWFTGNTAPDGTSGEPVGFETSKESRRDSYNTAPDGTSGEPVGFETSKESRRDSYSTAPDGTSGEPVGFETSGNADVYDHAVQKIRSKYKNIRLLLLSLGKDGSRAYSESGYSSSPVFSVNTIETTGAGDTFCGSILGKVLEYGMKDYSNEELHGMLTFANAAAALITEKKGALKVMPELRQINNLIQGS